ALTAVAALLVAAAPAPATPLPLGPGSQLDPASSAGVLAFTQRDAGGVSVVLAVPHRPRVVIANAWSPSLDGGLVAVQDAAGARVLHWADQRELARVDGALRPALRAGRLAFVRRGGTRLQLVVRRLSTGHETVVASVRRASLGRPSLHAGRIAWTVARRGAS